MKEELEEFLNNTKNFIDIKNRSEADFQFELGHFLREEKGFKNLRFEYQFRDFEKAGEDIILKKEADLFIENDDKSIKFCIEIKLLKYSSGSTNFFGDCLKDICYLSQLKKEGEIQTGYFLMLCSDIKLLKKENSKSKGGQFWKGKNPEFLSNYKLKDLPNTAGHKLKEFVKKNINFLNSKIIYIFNEEFEYSYCIYKI